MREKGKATAREVQRSQKLVAHCSSEGWGFSGRFNSGLGGFFSLILDSWVFSGNWFGLHLIGEGK
jgi:hypothetical protein